eukprot:3689022-Pyramimonas_sp.AAC.1
MADECRKWEEIVARPYDCACRGKGVEDAMWDLMLRGESCPHQRGCGEGPVQGVRTRHHAAPVGARAQAGDARA